MAIKGMDVLVDLDVRGDVRANVDGETHVLSGKQNTLTAGDNIIISNNVISATGTTFAFTDITDQIEEED